MKKQWSYDVQTARPASLRWVSEVKTGTAAPVLTTLTGWKYPALSYDPQGRKTRIEAYEATTQNLPGWSYEYDKAGEVTRAKRLNILTNGTDSAIASQRRDYDYDGVGNRDTASQGTGAALRTVSYHANEHNQYANDGSTPAIAHPRYVEIAGQAAIGAVVTVKVNGVTAPNDTWGTGEPGSYRREVAVSGNAAQWLDVEVSASVGGGTPVVKRGWMYAPPSNETQVHDEDGNLKEDARWTYEWDAENQLKAQEEKALTYYTGTGAASPPVRKRLEFAHDARHRRIQKVVKSFSSTTQTFATTISDTRFVYDQWNLIAELDALNGMRAIRTYTWGPDLSGTLQGAGGVGGLLALTHQGTSYHVCSDANGNVTALYATSGPQQGKVVARYDYDPFGNRITDTGPGVEICPFAFSTKYRDEETGDYDYINRVYGPGDGRWRSKDPIGERGGINLYCAVENDAVNYVDIFGLTKGLCRFVVKAGHLDTVEQAMDDFDKNKHRPCDQMFGAACGNNPSGAYVWPSKEDRDRSIKDPNAKYHDVARPDDPLMSDEIAIKIQEAEQSVGKACADPRECCTRITITVDCSDNSRSMQAARKGTDKDRLAKACGYSNVYHCGTKSFEKPLFRF
ncbi:MAG: RHS repeat-associated core domain-containing protein [Verrucomicrobiaceae bacterium]|nr:RHS repeat-associated core domain-containing protein [Verrucomicrobiaceae bacterium]